MQQFGLELLVLADGWKESEDREEGFSDRLRLALVAAGRDPLDLWPEATAEPSTPADPPAVEDDDADFDYSAVDWQEASADDWEQMQQALAESRVQVSGEHREELDEPPLPDMGDEFDREWQ